MQILAVEHYSRQPQDWCAFCLGVVALDEDAGTATSSQAEAASALNNSLTTPRQLLGSYASAGMRPPLPSTLLPSCLWLWRTTGWSARRAVCQVRRWCMAAVDACIGCRPCAVMPSKHLPLPPFQNNDNNRHHVAPGHPA